MAVRLELYSGSLPASSHGGDRLLQINEQNVTEVFVVEAAADLNTSSSDQGNKQYLLISGPDGCIVYGSLLPALQSICELPIAQLVSGILCCEHCSSVYREGKSIRLNAAFHSSSTSNFTAQNFISVQSSQSFLASLTSSPSRSAIKVKLHSMDVFYTGSSLASPSSMKMHLSGSSYSRDVVLPENRFVANSCHHVFSEEGRGSVQMYSNFVTITVRLAAGNSAVDQQQHHRRRNQLISSVTWDNLHVLARNVRPLVTFCHLIRPQTTNDRGGILFLNAEITETEPPPISPQNNATVSDRVAQARSTSPNRPLSSISSSDASGGGGDLPASLVQRLTTAGAMDTLPRLQRYPRVAGDMQLPPGWEARLDSNGRMFFVDHVNRTTTWQRPTLGAVAEPSAATSQSSSHQSRPLLSEEPSSRRPQSSHNNPPSSSSTAAAAAVRQRDQFVRRNESFRRLIGASVETNNHNHHHHGNNRHARGSSSGSGSRGAAAESGPPIDLRVLMENPAVRFLTRPDLLTFLSQEESASPEIEAARALFNSSSVVRHIVKHIRRDPQRFMKYQHNRELVHFLCGMAERDKPLPSGWDVRMDQSGRPFFLDHAHRTTTYIDPRLPVEATPPPQTIPVAGSRIPTGPPSGLVSGSTVRNVSHRTQITFSDRDSTNNNNARSDYESIAVTALDYSDRVIVWLKQPEIEAVLATRYPPFRQSNSLAEKVRRIIRHGRPALDHYSNDVHIAQMLSFFENDINSCAVPSASLISGSNNSGAPTSKGGDGDSRYDAFRTKVRNFYKKMASKGYGQGPAKLRLDIRRDHVLEDSFTLLTAASRRTLQKSRLIINFNTEEGLDYGGPQREFFFLVSRHLFNPYYGLFEYATSNSYAVHISPMSQYVDNAMQWYRFAGRVIALSLIHQHLLDAFFTPTFYKLLLRRRPTLDDLETEDPQYYNSLVYIRDNDITEADLGLTFSITEEIGGKVVEHELKPGGKSMTVTERNKAEYIQLVVDSRIQRSIAPQARQLQQGFAELLDPKLIDTFDARELELLIAGIPEIDLDDWRHNTEYRGGYHDGHPVIRWFWMAVERMDNDHRLRLLQFVTGTASLPYEGFAALRGAVGHARKFCIERWGSPDSLPRAHTCFNRLDLPPYPSFQILFDKLLLAVDESQSFGIE